MTDNQPSQPKGIRVPPTNPDDVDRELTELFSGKPAQLNAPVAERVNDFIQSVGQMKIAVIVPMFGYWQDVEEGFLNEETLKPSVNRIISYAHEWYTFVVAEADRMSKPCYDVLNGPYSGGNLQGVHMARGSTYAEYVQKGIEVALAETRAQYVMVINPWGIIQKGGLDQMVERVNLNGHSPIVCGYDLHKEIQWDQFDTYKTKQPREFPSYRAKHMLSMDFMGMKRMVAEMCPIDTRFKTQAYADRDFFQQVAMKNFDAVVSDRVPTFFFDVPWHQYVPRGDYDHDKAVFIQKWGFTPADIAVPN